ncbi:uncharacterized protein LOC127853136 [Dreissena polymorpha]|uniref:Uncharacterized protein n=1 Tax=Dreissena polymorpha TaxID=45954 RepID=A0A9D4HNU9_DREPO|nr:uncharacterized protein LOC127853136 [Dreissena polymorpha]KAH3727512.1 hypothetical protein DPMN_053451 [Dreissena polymorpha]
MWRKTYLLTYCFAGCCSLSTRCGLPIDGEAVTRSCGTPSPDGDLTKGPPAAITDDSGSSLHFVSHGGYVLFFVLGILLMFVPVIIHLCWKRKIAQKNQRAITAAREMMERQMQEMNIHHIFSITYGAVEPCDGPPTYEQTLADPDMGKPPLYDDLPPLYNEAMKFNQTGGQQPSTTRHT